MLTAGYTQGAELPDLAFEWEDRNGDLHDFSSGWTFQLKVGTPGEAAVLTKSTGITGAATAPNVLIGWPTSGELNSLAPSLYHAHLVATRTSDSKQRVLPFAIRLDPAIT